MSSSANEDGKSPLDPRRPLQEVLEDGLRQMIADEDLKPGDRLPPEADLATQLQVARGSIRSALQRLEVQRVLEVRRGLGWFVRTQAPDDSYNLHQLITDIQPSARDLLEMRLGLESTGVSLAAQRATDEELLEISLLSDAHRAAAGAGAAELLRTDEAFHLAIMRASGNGILVAHYQLLVPELAPLRARSYSDLDSTPVSSANDHDTILHFLQVHDRAGSRVSMVNHLMKIYNKTPGCSAALRDFA